MRTYKPQKRAMLVIAFVMALPVLGFNIIVQLLQRFIPFSVYYIMIPLYAILFIIVMIVLPVYFKKAFFTVSSKEITIHNGFISTQSTFIPASSVKSVTLVVLPLSKYTGMNFVVLNTFGARAVMLFLSKSDMNEISAVINNSIRNRASL
ncbi:MAG: PH domain-containing protein [Hominimerdicola sp.]